MALKTVVIGFGAAADTLGRDARMARYFPKASHAAVLTDHAAFDWAAVVDPSAEARARARERWGVGTAVGSLAELPEPESYACAVVATPPEHRGGVLDRLPNLRAIMLEKPAAASLGEARALAAACDGRGIAVQVNYWRRGVPGFRVLANGELEDRIGRPRAVFGVYGGGLRNTGSHLIDFVRFLLGGVADAEPASDLRPTEDARLNGDVAGRVDLRLEDGTPVCLLPTDFREYREASLDIWGSRGRLSIEQESLVTRVFPRVENRGLEGEREIASDAPETLDIPVAGAFVGLYDNLAGAVRGDEALVSPLCSALENEALLDRIAGGAAGAGVERKRE